MRGRHPHLRESIETFTKHFGGARADEAANSLHHALHRTEMHWHAADTEAGKLWELAQFGLQVRVEKAIHQWCVEAGVDFDTVYTRMAETYNEGYSALGHGEFVRPVLEHMDGDIGGHCVRQNAPLLDHAIARIVESGKWE